LFRRLLFRLLFRLVSPPAVSLHAACNARSVLEPIPEPALWCRRPACLPVLR
jgi:hypothetical protein